MDWRGTGDPVILVPGGCQSARVFDDFARLLTPTHRVLGVTARGCGSSGPSANGYGIDRQIDDLIGFLDLLGIERAAFAGHSSGGGTVIRLARRYPGRVTKVVTFDLVYAGVPPEFESQMDAAIRTKVGAAPGVSLRTHRQVFQAWELGAWSNALECEFHQQTVRHPDGSLKYRARPPQWQAAFAGDMQAGRYFESEIQHPALHLLARDLDRERMRQFPPAQQRALRPLVEAIEKARAQQVRALERNGPHVQVVWMAQASHYLFLDRAPEVASRVRQFLQSTARRP